MSRRDQVMVAADGTISVQTVDTFDDPRVSAGGVLSVSTRDAPEVDRLSSDGFTLTTGVGAPPVDFLVSVFSGGLDGGLYRPGPLTCFTDTAGTTPAAVGQQVARINDESGNGRHRTQSNVDARPYLRQDANGHYYLEYDGVDDVLVATDATYTVAAPHYLALCGQRGTDTFKNLFSAYRSSIHNHRFETNHTNNNITAVANINGSGNFIVNSPVGSVPAATTKVIDSLLLSGQLDIGVNGTVGTPTVTTITSQSSGSIALGWRSGQGSEYASIAIRSDVSAIRSQIDAALAALGGLTL